MERFSSRELAGRLDGIKQAKRDGWDLTVLVQSGGREIVVVGYFVGFAVVASGKGEQWR